MALLSAETTPITVIRSTVPPGTTEALSRELGDELVFMPEFLREASALQDSLNPSFILIGCHSQDRGRAVAKLFAPLLALVSLVPPSTAEMVKLAMNAYLYTLVSFWNEMHLICGLAGIPSPEIGKLCTQDPRVSPYGAVIHGRPVGGRCLPKDLAKLVAFAAERGFEPELLRAAQGVNESLEARTNGAVEGGHDPLGLPHLEVDGRSGFGTTR